MVYAFKAVCSGVIVLAVCGIAVAQEEKQEDPAKRKTEQEIVITAGMLKEDLPVGPYKQPQWTMHRPSPATRVYIQTLPETVEFEQWAEIRVPKDSSKNTETRLREEIAFGLDNHLQLDLYFDTVHVRDGTDSTYDLRDISAEIRWALADWDEIPGNPTLYFEYLMFNDGPDKIEPKLLLGGTLAPRWHWGLNLVHERELAGENDRDVEYAATAFATYTVIDQKLSVGPAVSAAYETEWEGGEAERTREVLIGPTIQFRPVKKAHLDLEPLFGVTGESKQLKMFIVFGWDF